MKHDIFVGRQPIFRRNMDLYAYELLFRGNNQNNADVTDRDGATSEVLYNSFMEIGLENIVGSNRAFVNLTEKFLLGDYPLPLAKDQLVLEILEDIEVNEKIIEAVNKLSQQGYTIALDDFIYRPELEPLIELADIIKIDILLLSESELRDHVRVLRQYDAKLLAEKVESYEDYERCKELGFDFFQGYYFARPNVVQSKQIPTNRLTVLQLITKLQDDELGIDEVEKLISSDATLSYRLLRMMNSPAMSIQKQVDSIKDALMLLGLQNIKNWASMMSLSSIDDKPYELITTALTRALMCQELGKSINLNPDTCFTIGMFSTLDAMLDKSLREIVPDLPLSKIVNDALVRRAGKPGSVLHCTLNYEKGNWNEVERVIGKMDTDIVRDAYIKAVQGSNELEGQLACA